MAKYWEIRESYGDRSRKSEAREAYDCGFEEGYEAAMKEMGMDSEEMGERSRRSGMRSNTYVEGRDRDYLGERRGRDSMGRDR